MAQRLNIKDLTNEISLHTALADVSKAQVEDILRTVFSTISTKVIAGDAVAIPGFGKFESYTSSTSGKKSPKFRPSSVFKDAVVA